MSESEMTIKIEAREIQAALAAPFELSAVKWKPQSVKGNRAMALAYIDVRMVQDRLDEVVGFENWKDAYMVLGDNSVQCDLSIRIAGEWITKSDVGSPSEQPDGGDRMKAAYSDALKRAAVKFHIGRYLYRLPTQWCDYDPVKRMFTQQPKLPPFAMPKSEGSRKPASQPQQTQNHQPSSNGSHQQPSKPATKSLYDRAIELEDHFIQEGRSVPNELIRMLEEAAKDNGFPADIRAWKINECARIFDATCFLYENQCKARTPSKTRPAVDCKNRIKEKDTGYAEEGRCQPSEYANSVARLLKENGFNIDKDWPEAATDLVKAFTIKWEKDHPANQAA